MNKQKLSSRDSRGLRERGQVILMVGLATLVMFGIVGLAVDVGRLYVTRVELGRAVDAAALSGILEFNGTVPGLNAAEDRAEWYFDQNEPGAGVTRVAWANPDANEMTVDATKSIGMIFLSVLGIHNASVSAHAKAGFGTQFLDAVLVLDATPSMQGNPITQAKLAATTFKNILLGANPQGNVKVGVTAFRGCFKPTPASSAPHTDCVPVSTWSSNLAPGPGLPASTLDTVISAIQGGGANTATNVCTGLAKGWDIISGPGNHNNDVTYPGNKQYMVILSDGDNAYWGSNTYTAPLGDDTPPVNSASTPQGTVVGSYEFPCQPIDSAAGSTGSACPSPWNNPSISSTYPCYKGIAPSPFTIDDNMDVNGWTGGSGWIANSWTTAGTVAKSTTSPQAGNRHAQLGRSGTIVIDDDMEASNFGGGNNWAASPPNWTANAAAAKVTTAPVQGGSRHVQLTGNPSNCSTNCGTISRTFSLSGVSTASLTFYARRDSNFSGTDRAVVEMICGSTTTLLTMSSAAGAGQINTTYGTPTGSNISLNACAGQASVTLRFRISVSNSTNDHVFIDTVAITATSTSCGVTCGNISRTFSLASGTANLTFYARRSNTFDGADRAVVEMTCGSTYTLLTLAGITGSGLTQIGTSYAGSSTGGAIALDQCAGQSSVTLRFRVTVADADTDQVFIDTVVINGGASSTGYLNGNDGSNPGTCNEDPRPRERQLDARTIKLAQAIKAQGVEIFVVAFSGDVPGCNLDPENGPNAGVIYNDENPAHCNAVNQTAGPAIPGVSNTNGPIGNNTHDGTANFRLLMCMTSNTENQRDHYFYASSANELQAIFTAIANQIAHRLIE